MTRPPCTRECTTDLPCSPRPSRHPLPASQTALGLLGEAGCQKERQITVFLHRVALDNSRQPAPCLDWQNEFDEFGGSGTTAVGDSPQRKFPQKHATGHATGHGSGDARPPSSGYPVGVARCRVLPVTPPLAGHACGTTRMASSFIHRLLAERTGCPAVARESRQSERVKGRALCPRHNGRGPQRDGPC